MTTGVAQRLAEEGIPVARVEAGEGLNGSGGDAQTTVEYAHATRAPAVSASGT